MDKLTLTVAEVAALLGLHANTIRRAVDRGELPAVKPGGRTILVSRVELGRWWKAKGGGELFEAAGDGNGAAAPEASPPGPAPSAAPAAMLTAWCGLFRARGVEAELRPGTDGAGVTAVAWLRGTSRSAVLFVDDESGDVGGVLSDDGDKSCKPLDLTDAGVAAAVAWMRAGVRG